MLDLRSSGLVRKVGFIQTVPRPEAYPTLHGEEFGCEENNAKALQGRARCSGMWTLLLCFEVKELNWSGSVSPE